MVDLLGFRVVILRCISDRLDYICKFFISLFLQILGPGGEKLFRSREGQKA